MNRKKLVILSIVLWMIMSILLIFLGPKILVTLLPTLSIFKIYATISVILIFGIMLNAVLLPEPTKQETRSPDSKIDDNAKEELPIETEEAEPAQENPISDEFDLGELEIFQDSSDEDVTPISLHKSSETDAVKNWPFQPLINKNPDADFSDEEDESNLELESKGEVNSAPLPHSFTDRRVFQSVVTLPNILPLILPKYYLEETGHLIPKNESEIEKLAAQLSTNGKHAEAADLYLQRGQARESIDCLRDGNLKNHAGLVALGVGDYVRAIDLLVDEVTDRVDPALCIIIAEIFVGLGDSESAMKLLRLRLAPKIKEQNAEHVYRFGRMMENEGQYQDAYDVYSDLLASGADSPELQDRADELIKKVEVQGRKQPAKPVYDVNSPEMEALSETQKKIGAWYYISKFITEDDEDEEDELSSEPLTNHGSEPKASEFDNRLIKHFAFHPKDMANQSRPNEITDKPLLQFSLLGSTQEDSDQHPFEVFDRYELLEIASKEDGIVEYKAMDQKTNQLVQLIKIETFGRQPEEIKKVLKELRALSRLDHPNLLPVTDFGVLEFSHFVASKFDSLKPLSKAIKKHQQYAPAEAVKLMLECAEGLNAMHEAGVLHTHLNSRNLKINDSGRLLIDYDAGARIAQTDMFAEMDLTDLGYMAPERDGMTSHNTRQDVYSLGMMLFHLLTGKLPHQVKKLTSFDEIVQFQMTESTVSLQEVDQDIPKILDELYQHCTAFPPEKAYQNVSDILPFLRQLASEFAEDEASTPKSPQNLLL